MALALSVSDTYQPFAKVSDCSNSALCQTKTNLIGFGPEVILYTGHWNVSLAATFLRLDTSASGTNNDYEGVGAVLGLAWEWWNSERTVSVGPNAQLLLGRVGSGNSGCSACNLYHPLAGALGLSLTFY